MPSEVTAAIRGAAARRGQGSTVVGTAKGVRPSSSRGLSRLRFAVGGSSSYRSASSTLSRPAIPDAATVCPMFDFTEPTGIEPGASPSPPASRYACARAAISTGSPSAVPVACISTNETASGPMSASAIASLIART